MKLVGLIHCVALAVVLLGCAQRSVRSTDQPAALPPPPEIAPEGAGEVPAWPHSGIRESVESIDLQPGWRLKTITPLLKSGGYALQLTEEEISGNTATFSAGEDFMGYETALYAIEAREGGGVRIEFVSAEVTKDGESVGQPRPREMLFRLPRSARFVRLVYLRRSSEADHDMAVVAANEMDALDTHTRDVQTNPTTACEKRTVSFCTWVPVGIAVRPEAQTTDDGVPRWVPAR